MLRKIVLLRWNQPHFGVFWNCLSVPPGDLERRAVIRVSLNAVQPVWCSLRSFGAINIFAFIVAEAASWHFIAWSPKINLQASARPTCGNTLGMGIAGKAPWKCPSTAFGTSDLPTALQLSFKGVLHLGVLSLLYGFCFNSQALCTNGQNNNEDSY